MYEELKCFIKLFTKLETFSNIQNSYQKILQKIKFYKTQSIETNRVLIKRAFWLIE